MIPTPPSPTDIAPLSVPPSRSPLRRGRSKSRSPRSKSRASGPVVIQCPRSPSSSRSSIPSWRLASGSSVSPSIPSTCGFPPPPIPYYSSPPAAHPIICQVPMPQTIIVPSSRPSSSVRSRSISRSSRPSNVVNSPSWSTSRSRSHSVPRYSPVIHPYEHSPIRGYSQWVPQPVRHPRFYFQDGNVTLEINWVQYKIHRHFLVMNSSVFAHELPPNIITKSLPFDVDRQAFELVLSLFYPRDCFSGHDIQSESDWHKVLIFACRYKMTLIRDMAITKVPSLDPIVKAELAAKYGLKDWLVPVYTDLCIKDLTTRKGWSAEEGKKIGLEGILALLEVKRDITDHLGEYLDREKVVKTVEEKLEDLNLI